MKKQEECHTCSLYIHSDIIFMIFQYLEVHEICLVGRTCKEWHLVSKNDYLWKKIYFRTVTHVKFPLDIHSLSESHLLKFKKVFYRIHAKNTERSEVILRSVEWSKLDFFEKISKFIDNLDKLNDTYLKDHASALYRTEFGIVNLRLILEELNEKHREDLNLIRSILRVLLIFIYFLKFFAFAEIGIQFCKEGIKLYNILSEKQHLDDTKDYILILYRYLSEFYIYRGNFEEVFNISNMGIENMKHKISNKNNDYMYFIAMGCFLYFYKILSCKKIRKIEEMRKSAKELWKMLKPFIILDNQNLNDEEIIYGFSNLPKKDIQRLAKYLYNGPKALE